MAYHESGHALVAMLLPGTDPVSRVSIIPRGIAALGYTQQLPTEDRYLMTRDELLDRLQILLGGRAAEEVIFGDISTGAQNDLQRASDIARSMVMEYGMSERLAFDLHPSAVKIPRYGIRSRGKRIQRTDSTRDRSGEEQDNRRSAPESAAKVEEL